MDHVDQVTKLLQPNFVMSSLDLRQAYGYLHIFRAHQKFFQFTWRGRFYCYITLPQVFLDAPLMFVWVTQPLMAQLQKQLIDILIYIDDTFLCAHDAEQLLTNLRIT